MRLVEAAVAAPPSVRQELNRKVWDTLAKLLTQYQGGEITDGQLIAAVDALWDATSGLQERDLLEWFSSFNKEKLDSWTSKASSIEPAASSAW